MNRYRYPSCRREGGRGTPVASVKGFEALIPLFAFGVISILQVHYYTVSVVLKATVIYIKLSLLLLAASSHLV